jgi:SAM-dependent methyltransferase
MSSHPLYKSHTGAEYFKRITALELNRRVRSAYQDLVLRIAPPGATLFDFGAGPGIDARFFAERGFTVDAYDVDPKMCEFFAAHCRDFIDSGRITLGGGGYQEFLARKNPSVERRVDLIISNFAPLNQVDDLHALFAKFHALTGPQGKALVSVLNPYFIGDMKSRWWWRNAPRLWRDGHFFVPGGQAPPHTRRQLADFRALSSPYFRLTRVYRGLPPKRKQHSNGVDLSRGGGGYAWLQLATCQFMVLLFEKGE